MVKLSYRSDWALRTCLSTAIIVFLCLYRPIAAVIDYEGDFTRGIQFSAFICIVVKDSTVGATLKNGIACMIGSLLSLSLSWITLALSNGGSTFGPGVSLGVVFFLTFTLQYIEMHPLCKKVGIALVILTLVSSNSSPASSVLRYLPGISIGVLAALSGILFPYPRMASSSLETHVHLTVQGISALLNRVILEWQYKSITKMYKNKNRQEPSALSPVPDDNTARSSNEAQIVHSSCFFSSSEAVVVSCKAWRRLRCVLWAVIRIKIAGRESSFDYEPDIFRRENDHCLPASWTLRYREYTTKGVRLELLAFLKETIVKIKAWALESRFGPSRLRAVTRYDGIVVLLNDLLLILSALEKRLASLEHQPEHFHIFFAFNNRPNFRRAIRIYGREFAASLCAITSWLKTRVVENEIYSDAQAVVKDALQNLERAKKRLDLEYESAREAIYYGTDQKVNIKPPKAVSGLPLAAGAQKKIAKVKPVIPAVAIEMNTFLFLLDMTAEKLFKFSEEVVFRPRAREAQCSRSSFGRIYDGLQIFTSFIGACLELVHELFPVSQFRWVVGIFPFLFHVSLCWWRSIKKTCFRSSEANAPRGAESLRFSSSWLNSPIQALLKQASLTPKSTFFKLRQSIALAVSITIAAAYGLYSGFTTEPPLAAFTIAFIAGGSLPGSHLVTSFNRSFGTVVASVYAIIILNIVGIYNGDDTKQKIIAGLAIVLFQYPATYVRSFPIWGYAGTTAGFTAPIFLLDPSVSPVVRVVDTYVATIIFLSVEYLFDLFCGEDFVLSAFENVIRSIENHFIEFRATFKAPEENLSSVPLASTMASVNSSSIPLKGRTRSLSRLWSSVDKSLDRDGEAIDDNALVQSNRRHSRSGGDISENSFRTQIQVIPPVGTSTIGSETLKIVSGGDISPPLKDTASIITQRSMTISPSFLDDISTQREMTKFIFSEFSFFGGGSSQDLKPALLAEIFDCEDQCHESIQILRWILDFFQKVREMADASKIPMEHSSSESFDHHAAGMTVSHLLHPLEPEFADAEDLVIRICKEMMHTIEFLKEKAPMQILADHVFQWGGVQEAGATDNVMSEEAPLDPYKSERNRTLSKPIPGVPSMVDFKKAGYDYVDRYEKKISKLLELSEADLSVDIETRNAAIFRKFDYIVSHLQENYEKSRIVQSRSSEASFIPPKPGAIDTAGENGTPLTTISDFVSNDEVKVVNTALLCTKDLLHALSNMKSLSARLVAFRKIKSSMPT